MITYTLRPARETEAAAIRQLDGWNQGRLLCHESLRRLRDRRTRELAASRQTSGKSLAGQRERNAPHPVPDPPATIDHHLRGPDGDNARRRYFRRPTMTAQSTWKNLLRGNAGAEFPVILIAALAIGPEAGQANSAGQAQL